MEIQPKVKYKMQSESKSELIFHRGRLLPLPSCYARFNLGSDNLLSSAKSSIELCVQEINNWMILPNFASLALLLSARSMMVVAELGHGEIHFHLHFEFPLKDVLYFTLRCISILI